MTVDSPDAIDQALVAAFLAAHDEASFRAIYARHSPLLYGLALRLCGGRRAEADDVLQETWIRAIARLAEFRWASALSSWLCGICVRCARELGRATQPREAALPETPAGRDGAGDAGLDLDRAIARLPSGYREVLVLHDVYGYTHSEVAGLLEIDQGTSKSQLARARRAARAMLGAGSPLERGKESVR